MIVAVCPPRKGVVRPGICYVDRSNEDARWGMVDNKHCQAAVVPGRLQGPVPRAGIESCRQHFRFEPSIRAGSDNRAREAYHARFSIMVCARRSISYLATEGLERHYTSSSSLSPGVGVAVRVFYKPRVCAGSCFDTLKPPGTVYCTTL